MVSYCIRWMCHQLRKSFKNDTRHNGDSTDIFTLSLSKNIVKMCLSWLLSCAANLQSCDLVDLKRHHHYSWLPGGGTEWNFYSAPESLLSLREKKVNAILHPILPSVPIFLYSLLPAPLLSPPLSLFVLCVRTNGKPFPLSHQLPSFFGSLAPALPSLLPLPTPCPPLTEPQPETTGHIFKLHRECKNSSDLHVKGARWHVNHIAVQGSRFPAPSGQLNVGGQPIPPPAVPAQEGGENMC